MAEEPAISLAARHNTQLMIAWMVLILVWPSPACQWTPLRRIGAVTAGFGALLAKESWIAVPIIVVALEWVREGLLNRALRAAAPWALGAAAYSAIHLAFLSGNGYLGEPGVAVAKLFYQMATFLWLEPLVPIGFRLTWQGVLALTAVTMAGVWGVRRKSPAAIVGVALLAAGTLPSALVPFLHTRYTAIPYAGVLLLALDTARSIREELPHSWRRPAVLVGWCSAIIVGAASMFVVRADCSDWQRVGDAHRRLLREAAQVADEFPLHRSVAVVRAERKNPLARIAASPRGRAKIYYPRKAPYGLIEPAPLFEWVLHLPGVGFRTRSAFSRQVKGERVILIHRNGRFEWAASASPDMAHSVEAVRREGFPVQIIRGQPIDNWP